MPAVVIAGREYLIERMDDRSAFEVECILAGALGPTLGISLAAIAEPAITTLAERVRVHLNTPGPDERPEGFEGKEPPADWTPPAFDLARLSTLLDTLDTADAHTQAVAEAVLDQAGPLMAAALDTASPRLVESITWERVRRLVELALLGPCFLVMDGKPRRIVDWKTLDTVTGKVWSTKWRLLFAALRLHFERRDDAPEANEP